MSIQHVIKDTSAIDLIDINEFISNHPGQHRAAKLISDWMSPPVLGMATIMVFALAIHTSLVWIWAGIILVLCVLVPTGYVFWLSRTGRVSDFHIPIRSQRVKPMLLLIGMSLLTNGILMEMKPPVILTGFAMVSLFIMLTQFLVTLKWKISGHATIVTVFCSVCTIFLGRLAVFSFVLVPVVIWARLRLRKHTVRQTLAGTVLGLSTFTLYFLR